MLCGILVSGVLTAQNPYCKAVLEGRVIDDHDETPLSFSVINLLDSGRSVVADEDAFFTIPHLCPGKYRVEIRHVGCEPEILEVFLKNHQINNVLLRLEHHHELREVEIAAQAIEVQQRVNTETIEGDRLDIERMNTLSEAVENASGASVLKSGPNISKPMIHGVFGNRVAVINQKVKLEDQQWGVDHAPAMELSESGSVAVVKGAQGVEYGPEAIGGAVVVNPPSFETQRAISGTIQAGGFSNGMGGMLRGMLSGSLLKNKRLNYRFSGSWNKSGDRRTPNYVLKNTGNDHLSFSGALQYRYKTLEIEWYQSYSNQEYGILLNAHNGNLSDLNDAISRGEPTRESAFSYEINNPRQAVNHQMTQIRTSIKPGDKSKLEFVYGFQQNQREEYDLRRGDQNEIPLVDLLLRTHNASVKYVHVLHQKWNLKTGAEGRWIRNKNNPETGTRPVVPNYEQQQLGGFILLSGTPGEIEIEAGIRYDFIQTTAYKWYKTSVWESLYADNFSSFFQYFNESGSQSFTEPHFNFHNISGAIGASHQWNEQLTTGIRAALASRPPSSPELFSDGVHLGSATIEYGSLNLNTEYALTGELYGSYQTEKISVEAAAFYQRYDGFILPEIDGVELTIRGAFPRMTYNQIDAAYAGVNWRIDWDFHHNFTFLHRGELTRGTDLERQQPLPFTPPPSFVQELIWTPERPTHKWSWSIALGVNSTMKQGYAPQVVSVSELQQLTPEEINEIREQGAFDLLSPPGEYHLLHARAQLTIPFDAREFNMALQINNLLNRDYRNYLNRFRYFAHDTGINVQVLLTLKF